MSPAGRMSELYHILSTGRLTGYPRIPFGAAVSEEL